MKDIVLIDSDDEREIKRPRVESMPRLTRGFNTGVGLMESESEGEERIQSEESDNESDHETLSVNTWVHAAPTGRDESEIYDTTTDYTQGDERDGEDRKQINYSTNKEDLTKADLTKADLTKADLNKEDLNKTDLKTDLNADLNADLKTDLNADLNANLNADLNGNATKDANSSFSYTVDSFDTENIHYNETVGKMTLGQDHQEFQESHQPQLQESDLTPSDAPLDSDITSTSFVQSISAITPETIAKTRRYLKEHGNMRFLQKYLPTAANSDDITQLILQLGFVPRASAGDDLMRLIKFLNYVMVKVMATRTRLDHVRTIDDALEQIRRANKILVITGAGISTSLGIPDFRSSEGFYAQVQHLGLLDPQEVFDLEIFNTDPSLFYLIAHMILPPEKVYSPLHAFIAMLQAKGKLLRNYTQNIDNLESVAGILPEKLVQCHGLFATATCMTCRTKIPGEQIEDKLKRQEIAYCPRCMATKEKILAGDDDAYVPESFGVYKPDITFFGESLPDEFHDTINHDLHECDLLISVGTSLKVAPVADIVDKVPEHVPQILFNKDPIDHCNFDVSLLGYCDDVATYMSGLLGEGWQIPHPRAEEIQREGLVCELIDSGYREYEVRKEGEKREEEEKEKEEEEEEEKEEEEKEGEGEDNNEGEKERKGNEE